MSPDALPVRRARPSAQFTRILIASNFTLIALGARTDRTDEPLVRFPKRFLRARRAALHRIRSHAIGLPSSPCRSPHRRLGYCSQVAGKQGSTNNISSCPVFSLDFQAGFYGWRIESLSLAKGGRRIQLLNTYFYQHTWPTETWAYRSIAGDAAQRLQRKLFTLAQLPWCLAKARLLGGF
jgi:hypothetical protein